VGSRVPKPTKKCKVCGNADMTNSPGDRIMGGKKFCSDHCYQVHTWKSPMKTIQGQGIPKPFPIVVTEATPNVKVIKDVPDRDKNYLKFVASFGCMVCNNPSTAHHVYEGGMGTKCSDYWTINLCDMHHTLGSDAVHRLGNKIFEEYHAVDIENQMRKLMRQYILMLQQKYESGRNK
jgi:hypothetical protein